MAATNFALVAAMPLVFANTNRPHIANEVAEAKRENSKNKS
jgi:hypothetical protein